MKPLFGGREFTAHVEDNGVRISHEEGSQVVAWCHWLGAIDLLCKKDVEDRPCVRIEPTENSPEKKSLEEHSRFVCVSQSGDNAIWIATILVKLNLASICSEQPPSIELTADGKRVLFSLLRDRSSFSTNLAKKLKEIEDFK